MSDKTETHVNETTAESEKWKFMYVNIRGAKGKRTSLIELLDSEKPHLFLLTETLLPTNANIQITGYTFFGKARLNKKGGGIAILVRNDIKNVIIPHISERNIEMIWVSIRRKKHCPLFIGCYYGKQESRCSIDEINEEMYQLSEEIEEYKKEGQIMIFMDGNGKLGLLGEEKSRNGKLLEHTFETHDLIVLNKSIKCQGKITRQNTKNKNEISAIDFVIAERSIEEEMDSMIIDEEGLMKIKGKTDTDHNTIVLNLNVHKIEKMKPEKHIHWRLNAPEADWKKFRHELSKLENEMKNLFTTSNITLDEKYKKWLKKIEIAARISIGKTTVKPRKSEQFSEEINQLRTQKRQIEKEIKKPDIDKTAAITKFKEIQETIRTKILEERTEKMNHRLKKITADKSKVSFWKERKKIGKNELNECLTVKDEKGIRQYNPEAIKEVTASYYETLYAFKEVREHPHHEKVARDIQIYQSD